MGFAAGLQIHHLKRRSGPPGSAEIALRYSQVLWLLAELGFQGAASDRTFNEYLKSLRKLGLPFEPGEVRAQPTRRAAYGFGHVMELALALTLRVYNGLPDAVLLELVRHRAALKRLYAEAYAQRTEGLGAPVRVQIRGDASFDIAGAFLDLQLSFDGGTLSQFGPPRLLSPVEALRVFAQGGPAARAFLPMRLSHLAERVVALAAAAPPPRRGGLTRKLVAG